MADRAATYPALHNPGAVAGLLDALRRVGAHEQAEILADRAAVQAPLGDLHAATALLNALRTSRPEREVSSLIGRLPAEGLFVLFRELAKHKELYQYGRKPDGAPAPSWDWDDLE